MIEKTIYIADDGTEFDNEDECLRYESKIALSELGDRILFFDENRRPLELSCDNYEKCFYIVIKDESAISHFISTMEDEGYSELPHSVGVYEYNTYTDKWVNLSEKVANIINLIKELYDNAK